MRNPLRRPGRGRRRFDPREARATIRRLASDLSEREWRLERKDERIRVLTGLYQAEKSRADQAEIVVTCLERTLGQRADAELAAITVPAPCDRRVPSGERTVETNVLALREHDDTAVRPYAPKPAPPRPPWAVQSLPERIAWGAGSDNPTALPGSEADTTVLPAVREEVAT